MAEFDTLIRGGTVIDGLQTPRYTADIAIKDGCIAYIGRCRPSDADRVLDADGLIVAPGFIDLHTHYDAQVFWDPYCTMSSWHGITSVVIGNCGFGFAPVEPEDRNRAMLTMSRNEAVPLETMQAGMPWDWVTFPEFLDSLDRTPKGVNVLSYIGLNPLMAWVMGIEDAKSRPTRPDEMTRICALIEEGMRAGACGFSAQMLGVDSVQRDYDGTPMITDTMSHEDLIQMAAVLGKLRQGFIQVFNSPPELTTKLAEVSGRPIIWNVIALVSDQHGVATPRYKDTMRWIEEANAQGNRVFGQALTVEDGLEFTFEDWNLYDRSPLWREMTMGTRDERKQKLADPERRARVREEYEEAKDLPRGDFGIPALTVTEVASDALQSYVGREIHEIAKTENKHPIDAMLDLAVKDDLKATFITPPEKIDMNAMKDLVNWDFSIPGVSDGGAHTKFSTLGRYPTEFIARWVREHEMMTLEQAHWRLSTYPAQAAGFRERGSIRVGAPADLIMYDYESLEVLPSEVLADLPAGQWRRVCRSKGYRWIMVNGEVTFEDGKCTGAIPGRLLRHGV